MKFKMTNQAKHLWRIFTEECKTFLLECFMPLIFLAKKILRHLGK